MSRQHLTQADFLRAIDRGQSDFTSSIFTEAITLSSRECEIKQQRNTSLTMPKALPEGRLIFDLCEFQSDVEIFDIDCDAILFEGAVFQGTADFRSISTRTFGGPYAHFKWLHAVDVHSERSTFVHNQFERGFMFKKFMSTFTFMDNVNSPQSLFNEADLGELENTGAHFGRRTPTTLKEAA